MAIRLIFKKVYVPHKAFQPVRHPHFVSGDVVQLIAQRKSSQWAWKTGDTGTVTGFFPDGDHRRVDQSRDLYRVELTEPRNPKVKLGYFYYSELRKYG